MVKPITVVQGYHFGYTKGGKKHVWINTTRKYNFRITPHTHNIKQQRVLRSCSVLTKRGKRFLVITNVLTVRGSKAIRMAKQLMPVIAFHNYGMNNSFLYMLLFNNTNTEGYKQKYVLTEFQKIIRGLHSHKTNQDILHYSNLAQRTLTKTYGKLSSASNEITSDKLIIKGDKLRHELKYQLRHLPVLIKHVTPRKTEAFRTRISKVRAQDIYLWSTQSNIFRLANAKDLKAKLNGLIVDIKHGWSVHDLNEIGNQDASK